jgi:hypothetical protein
LIQHNARAVRAKMMGAGAKNPGTGPMKTLAGSGALISGGREVPVRYDLLKVEGHRRHFAEGLVFGETGPSIEVFHNGPCVLRLESGRAVHAYLEDCRSSSGVADVRVTDPIEEF